MGGGTGRAGAGRGGGAAGARGATGTRLGRAPADGTETPPASAGRFAPQRQVKMNGGTRRPQTHVQAVLATEPTISSGSGAALPRSVISRTPRP